MEASAPTAVATDTSTTSTNGATSTPAQPAPPPSPDARPENEGTVKDILKYAEFLHVGPGAESCPDKENGTCGNPLHFHAFCRLPNQFQHAEIREHAMAAKARRMRQLRDSNADSHEILENELDELRRPAAGGGDNRELILDELVQAKGWKDWQEARATVADEDEDNRYEFIERDVDRLNALERMPERPEEEYEELRRHVTEYQKLLQAKREEIVAKRRAPLEQRDTDDLVDMIREDRITAESSAAFFQMYNLWEWFYGTLRVDPDGHHHQRVFADEDQLKTAAPEVVEALDRVFTELEVSLSEAAQGN